MALWEQMLRPLAYRSSLSLTSRYSYRDLLHTKKPPYRLASARFIVSAADSQDSTVDSEDPSPYQIFSRSSCPQLIPPLLPYQKFEIKLSNVSQRECTEYVVQVEEVLRKYNASRPTPSQETREVHCDVMQEPWKARDGPSGLGEASYGPHGVEQVIHSPLKADQASHGPNTADKANDGPHEEDSYSDGAQKADKPDYSPIVLINDPEYINKENKTTLASIYGVIRWPKMQTAYIRIQNIRPQDLTVFQNLMSGDLASKVNCIVQTGHPPEPALFKTVTGAPHRINKTNLTSDQFTWHQDLVKSSPKTLPSCAGVRAYVIDTGIDASHNEFAGCYIRRAPWRAGRHPKFWHGTAVASLIAGRNLGLAPGATLIDVPLNQNLDIDQCLRWIYEDLVDATTAAPAVINISWVFPESFATQDLIQQLYKLGVLCITASGNQAKWASESFPGRLCTVLNAGALDRTRKEYKFSNHGEAVDILAPGEWVSVAANIAKNEYPVDNGTSYAAQSCLEWPCKH